MKPSSFILVKQINHEWKNLGEFFTHESYIFKSHMPTAMLSHFSSRSSRSSPLKKWWWSIFLVSWGPAGCWGVHCHPVTSSLVCFRFLGLVLIPFLLRFLGTTQDISDLLIFSLFDIYLCVRCVTPQVEFKKKPMGSCFFASSRRLISASFLWESSRRKWRVKSDRKRNCVGEQIYTICLWLGHIQRGSLILAPPINQSVYIIDFLFVFFVAQVVVFCLLLGCSKLTVLKYQQKYNMNNYLCSYWFLGMGGQSWNYHSGARNTSAPS